MAAGRRFVRAILWFCGLAIVLAGAASLVSLFTKPEAPDGTYGSGFAHQTTNVFAQGIVHGLLPDVATWRREGGDPNEVSATGESLLLLALYVRNVDAFRALLDAGADPDQRQYGMTPIVLVALQDTNDAYLRALLDHGVDVNVVSAFGSTPLIDAVNRHRQRGVTLILAHGAAVDAQDTDGKTAIWLATFQGQTAIVQQLLAAHADPAIADHNGSSAIDVARRSSDPELRALYNLPPAPIVSPPVL